MNETKLNTEYIQDCKNNQDVNYYRKYITLFVNEIEDENKLKKIYEFVHAILIHK